MRSVNRPAHGRSTASACTCADVSTSMTSCTAYTLGHRSLVLAHKALSHLLQVTSVLSQAAMTDHRRCQPSPTQAFVLAVSDEKRTRPQSGILVQPPHVVHCSRAQRDRTPSVLTDVTKRTRIAKHVARHLDHRWIRPRLQATATHWRPLMLHDNRGGGPTPDVRQTHEADPVRQTELTTAVPQTLIYVEVRHGLCTHVNLTCRQIGHTAGSSGSGTPSGCGRGAGGGGGGGSAPVPPSLLSACVYHHSSSCGQGQLETQMHSLKPGGGDAQLEFRAKVRAAVRPGV